MQRSIQERQETSGRQADRWTGWARIWDLPTRLFHWLLVLGVIIAAKTGFFGPANSLDWHVWSGYCIGVLVIWRLIWGLFGSEYSRIDRLFAALRNLREHAGGLLTFKPKHHAGHNPAGSLMILGLIAVLLAITFTGIVVLGGVEKQGVLAGVTTYSFGHLAKGAHQVLAYALVAMVIGHIGGVVAEIVLLRVPLIRGMITGWLPEGGEGHAATIRQAKPVLALISTALAALAISVIAMPLSAMPGLGAAAPATNAAFLKECASCHWPVHPSLLPRASWKLIMGSLDQHFGEDASLLPATAAEIAAYLDTNAAETVDTEPANRFREVAANEPTRITATRFWKRVHDHLGEARFKAPDIKSKINCVACHRDALTGHFDDQKIDIPGKPATGASQ